MGNRVPLFKRYVEHARNPMRIGAFDLETVGLDGPIVGVGWQVEGEASPHVSTDVTTMLRAMLGHATRGVVWYAHNGGEFDFLHAAPHLRRCLTAKYGDDWRMHWLSRGDGRMIALTVRHVSKATHKPIILEWRDSMALLPVSLDTLASQFAQVQKLSGTIDFAGGEVWDPTNPQHVQYLEHDVTSLLQSMVTIRNLFWEEFHVNMRVTAASTGIRVFQTMMPTDVTFVPQAPQFEEFIRRGKNGGLTFLTTIRPQDDVEGYDVNSLYPYVMREHEYPYGIPEWRHGDLFATDTRLGMWECNVTCDDRDIIPIVPLRTPEGVMWPIGRFTTILTTPEIHYARTVGYTITPVRGLVWNEHAPLFREFITRTQTLKTENPGTALAALAKLIMNSCYGKFGQRRDTAQIVESFDLPDPHAVPLLDRAGGIVDNLWEVPATITAPYIQPQIAAYITAYARIYYHRLMMAAGGRGTVLYGDTDSMAVIRATARTDRLPIHPTELGYLKREACYATFQASASKTWTGHLQTGEVIYRSKGIPRRLRKEGQEGEQVEWDSLQGTRASLIRGQGITLKRQRRSLPQQPSETRWETDVDGSVHPIRVDQPLLPLPGR